MAAPDATTQLLKSLGQIAGIGGIAFGVLLLIFQGIIGIRRLFPQLTQQDAYRLLRLMAVLCSVVVFSGIVVYGIGIYRQNTISISDGSTPTPTPTVSPSPSPSPTKAIQPSHTAAMPKCVNGRWKEANSPYNWTISFTNEHPPKLRAKRNDGFQIIYEYRGEGLWQSEEVSIPIIRSGVTRYKRGKVTLELVDPKTCSELDTNDSNITLKRDETPLSR